MPIDAGKTLLLDQIRKSSVQAREAGGITQHIGASFFPAKTLRQMCGPMLRKLGRRVTLPGLLVIDTPGHEAFANLRKRGGGVADMAILVIDILKGFEAQTFECVEILRARKTPFLVAANKIDRIPGWSPKPREPFLRSYQTQDPYVRRDLDNHLYEIMGTFSRLGFQADRFDKVSDFTRTVAIVPVSAKTSEGTTELLAVIIGLTRQYLRDRLKLTEGPAKGTVLEVTEEEGLGITISVIIYDGKLEKGDVIVVGGKEKPIVTKVRAVLLPKPLDEIRDPRDKFSSVETVSAAAGVKIAAPDLENALTGAPLYGVPSENEIEKYVTLVSTEVNRLRISVDIDGIVLKTDTLGSLEAIANSLIRNKIPIRLADVGDVSKRDVMEATVVKEKEPLYGVILAFNVRVLSDALEEARNRSVTVFQHNIIYHLTEDYLQWMRENKEKRLLNELAKIIRPGKMRFLPGYVFRKAKPAIIGIEILVGHIKPKYPLVTGSGKDIGEITQIQDKGRPLSEAKAGMQVAISLSKSVVGRNIHEGDTLYVKVPEAQMKTLLLKFEEYLSPEEMKVLDELVNLMRIRFPFWGA